MVAIAGAQLTRRAEVLALAMTALAALAVVIVPAAYLAALPLACGAVALSAPTGRRLPASMAVWASVSLAVVVGGVPIA